MIGKKCCSQLIFMTRLETLYIPLIYLTLIPQPKSADFPIEV